MIILIHSHFHIFHKFTVIQTEQVQDATCSNEGTVYQIKTIIIIINYNYYKLCVGLSDCNEGQSSWDLMMGSQHGYN